MLKYIILWYVRLRGDYVFSSDIGSIITTSLLRNVSVVQSENSNNVKSNNVSFESILNNLGSYSSSNHCCSCNSGRPEAGFALPEW